METPPPISVSVSGAEDKRGGITQTEKQITMKTGSTFNIWWLLVLSLDYVCRAGLQVSFQSLSVLNPDLQCSRGK